MPFGRDIVYIRLHFYGAIEFTSLPLNEQGGEVTQSNAKETSGKVGWVGEQ